MSEDQWQAAVQSVRDRAGRLDILVNNAGIGIPGTIIDVSSMMGFVGAPARVAYTASKFAIRGMTKVAAVELGPLGIRVNSIHPGAIETDFIRPETRHLLPVEKLPLGRIGTPHEVAKLALFLASDDASYSTGCEFIIDGGWLSTTAL